ncbi:MAG TPA: translocation/assembly module TamB domain-containing protein [Chryseolinea sp.]|nr:translocation/assembly module TamB domain-containing protein [Chryseolinea sp.]
MFRTWTPKRYLIKAAKIIGWVCLSLVGFLLLLIAAIQIPAVQNRIVEKTISELEQKLGTKVALSHISISFPKKIVLEELYIEDQSHDTLVYAGELTIDTDLFALLDKKIQLNNISLDNWKVILSRSSDIETFNYHFIPAAFNPDPSEVPDTTATPWSFDIKNVRLTDVYISYHDSRLGNEIDATIGQLYVDVEELDLESPHLWLNSVEFENSTINVGLSGLPQDVPDSIQVDPDTKPFAFDVENVSFRNIASTLKNVSMEEILRVDLGEFTIDVKKFDLVKREIDIENVLLSNSFVSFQHTGAPIDSVSNSEDKRTTQEPAWLINLSSIELKNNSVQYYDFNAAIQREGLNFNNLWIRSINLQAKNLYYASNKANGEIDLLSFQDKSGFTLSSFKTTFAITERELDLKNFEINTPHSKIRLEAKSQFHSFETIADTYPEAMLTLKSRSSVGIRDLLYFNPGLFDSIPLNIRKDATVTLDTHLEGKVKDLDVRQFRINALSDTRLSVVGNIKGLPDKNAVIHASVDNFSTTGKDLKAILDDSVISKFGLPNRVSLKGTYDGTVSTPSVKADLTSDVGRARIDARLDLRKKGKETYGGSIDAREFQLGRVLQNKDLGNVDMKAEVKGSGTSMKNLNARVKVLVNKLQYRKYDYKNFVLDGSLKNYFFSGKASLEDKNLAFVFSGDLDYTEDVALYKFNFNLKQADLNALHLTQRPLKVRGTIDVDLATADFRSVNGSLDVRDVAIFNGEALYAVDSLLFASIDQRGNSKISIRSDIVTGDFEGTINLFDMGNALKRHFNNYYSLRDTTFKRPAEVQRFSFELVIKNTDLLTEILIPELEPFVPGKIAGKFDSEHDNLDLRIDITKIKYGNVSLDSLFLNVDSDRNSMNYLLRLRKVRMDTIRIEALSVSGTVANDSIRSKFMILDSLQKEKYVLGGAFYSLEHTTQFRLLSDEVLINYAPWDTPPDNLLTFGKQGIEARNFSITNINESLTFITDKQENATSIVFKDLNIQNLTNLAEGTIIADGLMNGNVRLKQGSLLSEIKIGDLDVFNSKWGDLSLRVSGTSNGDYTGTLDVSGSQLNLNANGKYQKSSRGTLNLTTTITALDLSLIEPFAGGQVKQMKGNVKGEIRVAGDIVTPQIRGELYFNKASFVPAIVGTPFTLNDEEISFTEEGIILDDFKITDENNNSASLDGSIGTMDYASFDLNLRLKARNFQLLNTDEDDSELFYGNVRINTDATISGSLMQPKIQMQVSLMEDSELTYIVPQSEKGVLEARGIVLFVDKDAKDDPFLASINPRDTVKSKFIGLDLTANIELDEKETLSIIIDPVTGDKLTVKGNSTLTLDIDPTGDMTLSGRYEITEGSYDLSFYKLVKRNFSIRKGSTITWDGDPLLAQMDITASYAVETSPLDLVISQMPVTDQQQINMYKQRLPFLVYLNIRGDLLTPDISFELDMPIDSRDAMAGSIYAKIKDINTRESDLNKQVFALLILRRFVSDNPFETEGGSDVAATARRSVSKLLTEQLNRLSENIKGIELSFDVKSYEDYSTGEAQGQTEVQLGVSKSLMDDRLVVKVSGNVDIEGNATNQNSFTDYIGDLALEYKLTEDGRFRITGFRNNNYDIISGELIETGAGLIYIKDYNALRELFKNNAKTK